MSEILTPDEQNPNSTSSSPIQNDEEIGLSIESVRAMLADTHECIVPKDDPVLMIVTMLNAYLKAVQSLHSKHEKGLSRLMGDKTDEYVNGIRDSITLLSNRLSSTSAESLKAIFAEHDVHLKTFRSNLTWLAAITACSALVNVAAIVLLGVR